MMHNYLAEMSCRPTEGCYYQAACRDGDCSGLDDSAPVCRRGSCSEGCEESFTARPAEACCVDYTLVECRPPAGEPDCPTPAVCDCRPPADPWVLCDGESSDRSEFEVALPAELFGPNCEAYIDRIEWNAARASAGSPDGILRMQRSGDPVFSFDPIGAEANVDWRVAEMNFESLAPIRVRCGKFEVEYDVVLGPSVIPPPIGRLRAVKTHANGGTLDGMFYVQPQYTFMRREPCSLGDVNDDGRRDLSDFAILHGCLTGPEGRRSGLCACGAADEDDDVDLFDVSAMQNMFGSDGPRRMVAWDAGVAGHPPIEFLVSGGHFVHQAAEILGIDVAEGVRFVPGIRENNPGDPMSQTVEPVHAEAESARATLCVPTP
jgi:hypothetical protein